MFSRLRLTQKIQHIKCGFYVNNEGEYSNDTNKRVIKITCGYTTHAGNVRINE
jgi:hypothetical protein